MWLGESETAGFWLGVLRSLRQRGVEDILISCTDSLIGLDYAIRQVFPDTEVQNCIVHQLRYSTKSVSYKDLCALMHDLKQVYMAQDEAGALKALSAFESAWDKKYPYIARSWRSNWRNLCAFLKYGRELRHLVYTTKTIEGFNRQLRKVTKAKTVFPTEASLLKMLYMATMDIIRKWQETFPDWERIKSQLEEHFGGRMNGEE